MSHDVGVYITLKKKNIEHVIICYIVMKENGMEEKKKWKTL